MKGRKAALQSSLKGTASANIVLNILILVALIGLWMSAS